MRPEKREVTKAEGEAYRHLQGAGQQHRRAGGSKFLEVDLQTDHKEEKDESDLGDGLDALQVRHPPEPDRSDDDARQEDRKSTRLNSSHMSISYAVFCLKKKKKK